mmetsp:Transcript_19017/g.21323  ORF Transcript_19017/g.21323 Transcript_19017/m.21323 type:complete len:188 (-) Transcript_19017:192-755(-)|eukprot:CAMPEP_0205825760 /NCGR_PEP_ID=MMETSP0206-20130828/26439_1 /ASSEMBLY_ACC=CAM_ASM_000279 /TAXON_ID=36767 /ORGANISM="Euplotes focardii, Strain TN1" /LENGTH=187 /DNA_ID=CAMNT_0053125087 /DNA_START=27 /DNA_END=590 /DNA_ORIENTATION=+
MQPPSPGPGGPPGPADARDVLPEKLLKGGKLVNTKDAIRGKRFGIFFSAGWAPPCEAFLPKLLEAYGAQSKGEGSMEIILVSLDKTPAEFKAYREKMPWLAVNFNGTERQSIAAAFQVNSIPGLMLFDAEGKMLHDKQEGIVHVTNHGADAFWEASAGGMIAFSAFVAGLGGLAYYAYRHWAAKKTA